MNEYGLMLVSVGLAVLVAWTTFKYLARLVVWSKRPRFDVMRYALITLCLSTEIGETFEWWEAALLAAVSSLAYAAISRQRAYYESAISEIVTRGQMFTSERGEKPFNGP